MVLYLRCLLMSIDITIAYLLITIAYLLITIAYLSITIASVDYIRLII